ncbi:MAG: hypothetical protein VKL39_10510 [Leptolyngbyaceae bacterium]|nr:hypothetical protein [Leptolyngbyaceae bacterium]
MTYSTEQLVQILDEELRATWKGERILLSSSDRLSNSVVAKALGNEKLSKVFAYQDFQKQVQQYQRDYGVSGIIWQVCRFGNSEVRYPELHHQLVPVPGDKAILMAAKPSVVEFWWAEAAEMLLWLAGHTPKPLTRPAVEQMIHEAEWVEIAAGKDELYLSLCWGDPKECHYQWAWPDSRCERVIASESRPIMSNL